MFYCLKKGEDMRKTLPMTGIQEDFTLTESTQARIARDYPSVDVPATLDRFVRKAEALGWMYRNWQAAFLNYLDNGSKYGGVVYVVGKAADPLWKPVLEEAGKYGFRLPMPHETPSSYRTQLMLWRSEPKTTHSNISNLRDALKSVNGRGG
jgi:hypothetical protein